MTVPITAREQWGARHQDGDGPAPAPFAEWWLHHSVTTTLPPDATPEQEVEQVRRLEAIGEARFGAGISYTYIVFPSGRVYEGHSIDRRGTHTNGRNTRSRGICLAGNYEVHEPTAEQVAAVAGLIADHHRAGLSTARALNGGHRDVKETACPGRHAYARIGEVNRLAAQLLGEPAPAPAPQPRPAPRPAPAPTPEEFTVPAFPTTKQGDRNPYVGRLQGLLLAWGYRTFSGAEPDDDWGPRTEQAMLAVCKRLGLVSRNYTGRIVAGPRTVARLVTG